MIYFTAHTFKCVCHCRKAMFRVLGMYNFGLGLNMEIRRRKRTGKGVYKMNPSWLNSSYAEVEIQDLTFLRCDYKFSYVTDIEGAKFVLGRVIKNI